MNASSFFVCWESACIVYSAEGASVIPPLKLARDTLSAGGKSGLLLPLQKPKRRLMFVSEAQSNAHDDVTATDCHQSSPLPRQSWEHFVDN